MQINTNSPNITAIQNNKPIQGRGRQNGAAGGRFGMRNAAPQAFTTALRNSANALSRNVQEPVQQTKRQSNAGTISIGDTSPAMQATNDNAALSANEADTLGYMREEEKLARDVYRTLYDQWRIQAFDNIANSEQQHMDTMASMIDKYGLEDPVMDDSAGSFTNPELASLYDELVERGSQSAEEALKVGAFIEEVDILDLKQAIDESSQTDLDQAYANLMKGSRNHLRAFTSLIEGQGVDYQAQVLSQDEVEQIADSDMERGNINGRGRGRA